MCGEDALVGQAIVCFPGQGPRVSSHGESPLKHLTCSRFDCCSSLADLSQEYVPGGDFRTLLNNSGVLKEEHARFYAAEMFAGVNELHKLGYIHRDLKPEVSLVSSAEMRV